MIKGQALSVAVVSATLASPKVHQICKLAEDAMPGNSMVHILCLILKLETLLLSPSVFTHRQNQKNVEVFRSDDHPKNLESFI